MVVNYQGRPVASEVQAVRAKMVDCIAKGSSIKDALEVVGRSRKWHENLRYNDKEYAKAIDAAKAEWEARKGNPEHGGDALEDFEVFCRDYLNLTIWPHQMNMVDAIEGREPGWLHPSMIYEPGTSGNKRVLISIPPNHCAVESTPLLTANRGWTTVGEVGEDDLLFSPDGTPVPVIEAWTPDTEVPVFDVTFDTGDVIRTDAGHKWVVSSSHSNIKGDQLVTTEWLMKNVGGSYRYRVAVADPLWPDTEPETAIDPYLLGYWLGDGDSNGYRLAVSVEDLANLTANLELAGYEYKVSDQLGGHSVYVYQMTSALRDLGLVQNKHIPDVVWSWSPKQRLALLQGLMDSDGTISAKDGRAKFSQVAVREELNLGVYRLIASLGYKPFRKEYTSNQRNPQGREYRTTVCEISFRPDSEPVFRLDRKAHKQKPAPAQRGRSGFRVIRSVTPAGTERVKCLSVANDDRMYLIGDSLIPTANAKTMTMSISYVTWRILKNPNISILIVSKTAEMAKKILYAVKQRLTHPRWSALQRTFGPPEGFRSTADAWSATRIYLGSDVRDTDSKDPTVESTGMGGQIYGARCDLIILDDTVTLGNAGDYGKQDDWLRQEVASRLGPGGQILVVGTRVAPMDLYRHLRDPENYTDGHVPWTYLAMPAVLEEGVDAASTTTLWPESDEQFVEDDEAIRWDAYGKAIYPRWTPERMARVRNEVGPKRWSLVYQNSDVAEDSTFDALCVRASVDGSRNPGPLHNREGWHVLVGVDPAIAGQAGLVVYAVHRATGKRMVLDVRSLMAPTPKRLRDEIKALVELHAPQEVIVETNAYQGAIVKDEDLIQFMASTGTVLKPHQTGREKLDPDFGVASMSALFGTRTTGVVGNPSKPNNDNLLTLPKMTGAVRLLVEELVAWNPEIPVKRRRQDLLMALFFAEQRARELVVRPGNRTGHFVRNNEFLSGRDRDRQVVINLADWQEQMEEQNIVNWI